MGPIVVVETAEQARNWIRICGHYPVYGLDCETEGINPKKEPASGPKGHIVCFTLSHLTAGDSPSPTRDFFWANEEVLGAMAFWLCDAPVVGHNLFGFDRHMFLKHGIQLNRIVMDTMNMSRLLFPYETAEHGLKSLMHWRLGIEPVGEFKQLFSRVGIVEELDEGDPWHTKRKVGEQLKVPTVIGGLRTVISFGKREMIPLSQIPELYPDMLPVLYEYACLDAVATLMLYAAFTELAKKEAWTCPLIEPLPTFTPKAGIKSSTQSASLNLRDAGSRWKSTRKSPKNQSIDLRSARRSGTELVGE